MSGADLSMEGADFGGELAEKREQGVTGARRGLMLAGQNTLNVSNRQVPHEEGDLERDGTVSEDDDELRVAISYGHREDTAQYAVPQHERMDYKHDPGRNAKFLENAMMSTRADNGEIIAQSARQEMGV